MYPRTTQASVTVACVPPRPKHAGPGPRRRCAARRVVGRPRRPRRCCRRPRRSSGRPRTGSPSCSRRTGARRTSRASTGSVRADQADVVGRASGVGHDRGVGPGVESCEVAAGDRGGCRPRADRVNRRSRDLGRVEHPAGGRHDQQPTLGTPQSPSRSPRSPKNVLINGLSDASIAADDVRRYSRMTGFKAWPSVTGTPGRCRREQLADALLVRRIDDRPEERHGDRLDLGRARAVRSPRVLRSRRAATTTEPSAPMRSGISNVSDRGTYGSGILLRVVEERRPAAAFSKQEDVRVALRDE